jgi:hypothetical protein
MFIGFDFSYSFLLAQKSQQRLHPFPLEDRRYKNFIDA